jgi:hypothetical protein
VRVLSERNSAGCAASMVRHVPGDHGQNQRLAQRELLLLRVDWLGSRVALVGLIKDEAFARSRLIPGSEVQEVMNVKTSYWSIVAIINL